MKCLKCGRELDIFDIGTHKKLINRGAEEFLCIPCIAEKFNVTEELIHKKIYQFRKMGCLLFPPLDEENQ